MDDILSTSSDLELFLHVKGFLSTTFDMKDFVEASFVLGVEIHRERGRKLMGLSQFSYI